MTKDTLTCPDCDGTMEVGFLPEVTQNGMAGMTVWQAGPPDPQKFLGLFETGTIKVDWKHVVPVTTFRCRRCGLLKSYALPADPS
jgi:hypothetical protein